MDEPMADVPALAQDADVVMEDTDTPRNNAPAVVPADALKATSTDGPNDVKLEDLFADGESDDDFAAEKDGQSLSSSPHLPSKPPELGFSASDPEVMRTFYSRLFPWWLLFQWLNHGSTPSNDFGHREFAFTLQNDAYLRYQSFATGDLLKKDVLRLMPSRFEIGPVYTSNPRERKTLSSSSFKPLSKELCIDIDLTDYDDIRTCCDKANICRRCWRFMTMAIKVLDAALRDDFNFQHILWVYSGRRGAHAWVCDKHARNLTDQQRRAVAGYLEVVRGGSQGGKKVHLRRPLHPHLMRSLDILKPHFQSDVLEEQDPWGPADRAEKLLQLLPDRALNESLRRKWDAAPGRSSSSKWSDIDAVARTGASKSLDARALLEAKQHIVLEYTYPRIDIEVSKKLNHLLKSPFVVHPGTGRVCVPILGRGSLEDFDPLAVPTVQGLLTEIDAWKGDEPSVSEEDATMPVLPDWDKTSLKPYIHYFRGFISALLRDEKQIDIKIKREGAASLDF